MRRIPNLETAIDECRKRKLKYWYEWYNNSHIKFYINGFRGCVYLTSKKDNPDRVRKDVEKFLTGVRGVG